MIDYLLIAKSAFAGIIGGAALLPESFSRTIDLLKPLPLLQKTAIIIITIYVLWRAWQHIKALLATIFKTAAITSIIILAITIARQTL